MALAAFLLLACAALAQSLEPSEKRLDQVRLQLDQIQASLTRADQPDAALQDLRAQLDPIAGAIQEVIVELSPRLEAIRLRLDQLKPKAPDKAAPDKPAAPEKPAPAPPAADKPDSADSELADQEKSFKDIDAVLRRARSLAVETEQTQNLVGARRRALFTRALFERSSSLLQPGLWLEVARDLPHGLKAIGVMGGDWLTGLASKLAGWRLPLALGLFAALAGLVWPVARMARRVAAREAQASAPARLRKVLAACGVVAVTAAVPFAFIALASALADGFDLGNARLQPFFRSLAEAILRIALALAIGRALLSPGRPDWRLAGVGEATARHLRNVAVLLAALLSATKLLGSLADVIAAALPVLVAVRGIGALLFAAALAHGLRGLGAADGEEACLGPRTASARDLYGPLRLALWAAAAAIAAAVLVGYVAFASFLADQIFWVACVVAVVYLLAALADEGFAAAMLPSAPVGRALASALGIRKESLAQLAILLAGAAQMALYGIGALLVVAPWGLQSEDLAGSMRAAFFGFSVGDVTISPSNILVALLLFGLALGLTRAIQGWLDQRFLPLTQLDRGLRNSIRTSLGYLGFVLAAGLALSHLGLGLERLAIVAGALSVGIGFGLQSIVNNFVSGLILLWERAIRVGDWIVVGEDQGYVRRINVRSTEIETFDRLTVIVPNSNLVSGVVKNWVRGDRVGRVRVTMVLGNETDTEAARDLLVASARAHESVLRIPAPAVVFAAIGPSSSTLDLFCYVDDVETSARIRSDLLFDIHKRFKAAALVGVLPPPPVPAVVNVLGLERLVEAGRGG